MSTAPNTMQPVRGRLGRERLEVVERHALERDVDLAAAREPDREGELVRDAVRDNASLSGRQHLLRELGHLALDAAARDRPMSSPRSDTAEPRSDRPRRGALRRDHGREGGVRVTTLLPAAKLVGDLAHETILAESACTALMSFRQVRSDTGRNVATKRHAGYCGAGGERAQWKNQASPVALNTKP